MTCRENTVSLDDRVVGTGKIQYSIEIYQSVCLLSLEDIPEFVGSL